VALIFLKINHTHMAFSRRDLFAPNPRRIADLSAALSHPARVKIVLHCCKHGETPYSKLLEILPLHPSTVSQHLRVLRRFGILLVRGSASHTYYFVDGTALKLAVEVLSDFTDELATYHSDDQAG
jgi:ArsR family transcriptional regulator